MNSSSPGLVYRSCACLIALIVAAALASCGGGDDDPQELSYAIKGKEGKTLTIVAPEKAEAGLAEITFTNKSEVPSDLQLIRVEGDRTPKEVIEGLGEAIRGNAFPDWLFAAGGVGSIEPGESASVEQVLQPGDYYALNTEAVLPETKSTAMTEVTGEESDAEIGEGEATVEAAEYVFNAETLPSGPVEIAFDNIGAQPHHLIAAKIKGDATAEDVEAAFKENETPPLEIKERPQVTAVLEGGEGQLVTLDLEPGRYVLYCFITDRQGGEPHALKGMVDEVEVE